ncbi:MAG TPA: alpha/beta hydrolase domain-containing protein [Gammaproteobacteria bacterium]|nr:alpha/beta hydrolase domain-containing protein [Gammaproteobacteria bacterium]
MPSHPFARIIAVATSTALLAASALAQPPGSFGGPRPEPEIEGIPRVPTAVPLPSLSAPVTGPGRAFDSAPSLARGLDLEHFRYETTEYFVSGTAAGNPYTTRVVVRQPADQRRFSGLVLAESMHGSGAAHMFEFTSAYLMDSGHAAVEIVTTSPQQFVAFNAERYASLKVENGQQNEIIAQVGALMRSSKSPLAGPVRKMVLGGTSMSAGTLINYLPAHMVFRTPEMNRIFDGFMPTSNGSTIREIDVPLIQMPTMHEVETNVTRRQDGDEPGKQYRLYEFSGIGHVDSRDNVRLLPNPCTKPLSTFLTQAYFSVTLHHLLRWVDEGIVPPRAPRILLDRDESNDGSTMALDAHGNPLGGIRSPYVDVPTAKYAPVNTAADPGIANPSEYVRVNGLRGAEIMCRLSAYQEPFSQAKLRELYGSKREYLRKFEARLSELEREGWSLPVYRETILADVARTEL